MSGCVKPTFSERNHNKIDTFDVRQITKKQRKWASSHHVMSSSLIWIDAVLLRWRRSIISVGLDEDLTNAVTKPAVVSLWWHWSTGLVNRNVFRTWLMCFLLTPVTHVYGGCLRSGNQSGLDALRVSQCRKRSFSLQMNWKNRMIWKSNVIFLLGFVFVGDYPRTDAKTRG